jgi:peptidoglycan L-alanyl-D-glutamate endopeptidase CwlK
MNFILSQRSVDKLRGVHPDLVRVVHRAIQLTPIDFGITCGTRSQEEQRRLVAEGKSRTMNSRHLTGHAVDFVALINGRASWDFKHYSEIAQAFKHAALELGIAIVWGGDWPKFRDGPHIELDRRVYP